MRAVLLALMAALALVTGPSVDAGSIRLRIKAGIGAGGGGVAVMPTLQTVYFGSMTPNGYGGHKLGCNGCAYPLSISNGDTNNWQIIDSDGDGLGDQLAPRQSASATYASVRTVALSGSYALTVSDSLGRASAVTVSINDGVAGKFTITNRDNIDQDGSTVTTQNQLRRVMALAVYGETVGLRNGMLFNQPENGGALQGLTSARIRGVARGTFNGSNWVVVRPETGGSAILGPITVDDEAGGNKMNGTSFQGITFRSPPSTSRAAQPIFTALGSTRDIELYNNVFTSGADPSGTLMADGVLGGANSYAWIVRGNYFYRLANGVTVTSATGNNTMTAADYSDPTGRAHTVTDNIFAEVGKDTIDAPCASGGVYSRNLVYDKVGAVYYGATGAATNTTGKNYVNPFDALYQPHADGIQFDYSQCYYGRYAGPVVEDNIFLRGNGRDTLPFWTTAAGYPDPNLPSGYGSSTTGIPTTLDTSLGLYDMQAIFTSQTQVGAVRVTYAAVLEGPVIRRNFIQQTYANGITFPNAKDVVIEFNTVITDYPGPTNLTGTSTNIRLVENTGTATVRYNIMSGAINFTGAGTLAQGTGSGTDGGTNYVVGNTGAAYAAYFLAPAAKRRSFAEASAAFRPLTGQLRPGGGYVAGAIGPDGQLNTMAIYP